LSMRGQKRAYRIALAAMMAGMAVLTLYIGSMLPTGHLGMAALAGLMPAAAILSGGLSSGALCWSGASLLSSFLVPDKLMPLMFAALFGLYPLVKNMAERLGIRVLEYLIKLAFFNCMFTLIYQTMKTAVLALLPASLKEVWMLYLAGNFIFLLYDYGFSRLISLYMARVTRMGRR